jgi:arsenate reductase (thioredoxin)
MRYVLFVCNHNAGRSQMAQAFFERLAPEDLRAESAGGEPVAAIWPEVVEVMQEVGMDLRGRKPKRLTREMQLHADWAITMGCGDACPYVPATVEDWDLPDPAGRPIAEVREIRDTIEQRVERLLAERIEDIRSDRTAHELRLAQLLPALVDEFEGRRSDGEIRACADAVLSKFDDARVRTHVVSLALRQTRECLREDRCEALAAR